MQEASYRTSKIIGNLKNKYSSGSTSTARKSSYSHSKANLCQGTSFCVCIECDNDCGEEEEIKKLKKKLKKAKSTIKKDSLVQSMSQARAPLASRINLKPDTFNLKEEVDLMERLVEKSKSHKECSCSVPQEKPKNLDKYERKLQKMKEQLFQARGQRREWEAKLASFEPQRLELERRVRTLESTHKALEDEKTRAQMAERKASAKLQSLQSGLSFKDNEMQLLQRRIDELEKEKSAIMNEIARMKSQFVYAEGELKNLRADRDKIKGEFETKERGLKAQLADLSVSNQRLMDDLQLSKSERDQIIDKLRILKGKKHEMKLEFQGLLDRIPFLERERGEMLAEIERLRRMEKVVEVPVPTGDPRLEAEVVRLRNEVATLQNARRDLVAQNEHLRVHYQAHSQSANSSLAAERDNLRMKLADADRHIAELQSSKNSLMGEIERLTQNNSEKNRMISSYMNELASRNVEFERQTYNNY